VVWIGSASGLLMEAFLRYVLRRGLECGGVEGRTPAVAGTKNAGKYVAFLVTLEARTKPCRACEGIVYLGLA